MIMVVEIGALISRGRAALRRQTMSVEGKRRQDVGQFNLMDKKMDVEMGGFRYNIAKPKKSSF